MKKSILSVILCAVMVLALLSGCALSKINTSYDTSSLSGSLAEKSSSGYSVSALVLYSGSSNDGTWKDTLGYLQQSTLTKLSVSSANVDGEYSLDGYDVVFPDSSVMQSVNKGTVSQALVSYVSAGGSVFLDNAFYDYFSCDFIGASAFVPVTECPVNITVPDLGDDLGELQDIVFDFTGLYKSFADYSSLAQRDYGYAAITDTAVPLICWNDYALYTMNRYGNGYVFFTNPLLPNNYCLSGFSMEERDDQQTAFSSTAASCNQLLLNAFASYVFKQQFGYSLERVFGSFGSPNMAWELHYEEITGIENSSLTTFSELCKEYLQVPSYSLIRSTYTWLLRTESVTYLLNQGGSGLDYEMDVNESAYSSGTHIAAGDEWLSLGEIENAGSYFAEYPQYTYRAYPDFTDYNSDGITDIFCGSYDGGFYYFEGKNFDTRLCTAKAVSLTDLSGNALSISGYSAPQLFDLNGDGYLDIVSGCDDGNIYWFAGNGTLAFQPEGLLIGTDLCGQSMPSLGDLNGDNIVDIAVGSNEGILLVYYGTTDGNGDNLSYSYHHMAGYSGICTAAGLGKWLAPEICDYNGDNINDLAVGTYDGYVALFCGDASGNVSFDSYLTADEMNFKGNNNIKFGNNCVPVFYDLNCDGAQDIVCGSLEYGMAYPIDSEYFQYREQLQEQIDYLKANDFYMGIHFYTNSYASPEREAFEIDAQKKAFETYGLETGVTGTNQHTWYTSRHNDYQSFLSEWNAGLLWNSGFAPAGATFHSPQAAAENVISLPFFLTSDGKKTILMQNCSVLPYTGTEWTDISAKYGVPICVFYHCDSVYESDSEARAYLQALSDFQWKNNYNFVMENQMMQATAAEYNMALNVSGTNPSVSDDLNITLQAESMSDDFALYNADYQNCTGVKISFSDAVNINTISTDDDVWYTSGNSLYLGLNKAVHVYTADSAETEATHVERVNIAANVEATDTGATIGFLDNGMMQVVVSGGATTADTSWTITDQSGKTAFTKYGTAETLTISYIQS
jgi:hypothetical protein